MPFSMIERAEIACVEDGDTVSEAKRDDLIRRMMQGIADEPFRFLAGSVSGSVQTLASSRLGLRSGPFLAPFGLDLGPTLLHGSQTPTRHRDRLFAVRDHAQMNHADIESSGFTGFRQHGFGKFVREGQVEFTKAQLRLHQPPGGQRLREVPPNGGTPPAAG